MLHYLISRLRRSPIREDAMLKRTETRDGVKNVQFVSFLQQSGFRKRALDRHDKTKRFKKSVAILAIWSFLIACGWIAYESAEALELF
ncbi:hypothetical protein [Pelagicoccus sp. SDUM812002]|uniref:hypothetical protein n=1 Tax=Pelagicoccus sp. SDUM812002 TaxID=3041266 RepID=UPI00280D0A86|nr:hypothetical protein [Pelagicoccus sp. SDUM812002]MDQ8186567.1 hypothetical protein [Pelagicoccus sp. SDUM812002]